LKQGKFQKDPEPFQSIPLQNGIQGWGGDIITPEFELTLSKRSVFEHFYKI